ncbi:MAG: hypothetical protein PHO32_01350 [Candidatus Cloacimonetes bacterium]|nr:hypothetical protein [Candidatus Cloacimonadota bacterium]
MKRLIFLLAAGCLSLQLHATIKVQLGAGLDLNGKQTFSNSALGEDGDVNTGVSLYGELLSSSKLVIGDMMYGIGMEYQLPREMKNLSPTQHSRQFAFLPIYATLKYSILPLTISPEVIVQGGYNFLVNEKNFEFDTTHALTANGGFYWAAGAGVNFKPFVVQIMYKSNQSSFKWSDVNLGELHSNNVNSQLSLQLGVRL